MVIQLLKCLRDRAARFGRNTWERVYMTTLGLPKWAGALIMFAITLVMMPLAVVAAMLEAGFREAALWLRELKKWAVVTYRKGGGNG